MKILGFSFLILLIFSLPLSGQDKGLPGEDFDLEALPGIIETVSTFEELEKAINTEKNQINNLDLDRNGEVDYITIKMEKDGDAYIAYLQVAFSETEIQDVASIQMEKQSSVTASFQIVGEESMYGKDYILEPEGGLVDISESTSTNEGGKGGPSFSYIPPPPAVRITICVGVYRPGFRVWVSPYGFRVYPAWYRPWHPVARHHYRHHVAHWHRVHYQRATHYRSARARNMHNNYHNANKATHYNNSKNKSAAPSSNKSYNTSQSRTNQNLQPTGRNDQNRTSSRRPIKK